MVLLLVMLLTIDRDGKSVMPMRSCWGRRLTLMMAATFDHLLTTYLNHVGRAATGLTAASSDLGGCSGSWGKLGLGSDANVAAPRPISALKTVPTKTMACGGSHSVAITVTGDVWTWGKAIRGQLGHNSVKEEYSPRLCATLRKLGAERVKCGEDHTLVSLRNGRIFAFGWNFFGQLGLSDNLDRCVAVGVGRG